MLCIWCVYIISQIHHEVDTALSLMHRVGCETTLTAMRFSEEKRLAGAVDRPDARDRSGSDGLTIRVLRRERRAQIAGEEEPDRLVGRRSTASRTLERGARGLARLPTRGIAHSDRPSPRECSRPSQRGQRFTRGRSRPPKRSAPDRGGQGLPGFHAASRWSRSWRSATTSSKNRGGWTRCDTRSEHRLNESVIARLRRKHHDSCDLAAPQFSTRELRSPG